MADDNVGVATTEKGATLSAKGLARLLNCTERTVRRWDSAGEIPAPLRIGARHVIWPVAEIEAWMRAGAPGRKSWDAMKKSGQGKW